MRISGAKFPPSSRLHAAKSSGRIPGSIPCAIRASTTVSVAMLPTRSSPANGQPPSPVRAPSNLLHPAAYAAKNFFRGVLWPAVQMNAELDTCDAIFHRAVKPADIRRRAPFPPYPRETPCELRCPSAKPARPRQSQLPTALRTGSQTPSKCKPPIRGRKLFVAFLNCSTSARDSPRDILAIGSAEVCRNGIWIPNRRYPGSGEGAFHPLFVYEDADDFGGSTPAGRPAKNPRITSSLSAIWRTCFGETKLTAQCA